VTDADEILRLIAAAKRIPYCPQTPLPTQRRFLLSQARELLFGGAAGGSKSSAVLMGALEYVDVPGYAAMIFRKTLADLSKPGALMDRAATWLRGSGARWNDRSKTWRFSSVTSEPGATLGFGFLDGPLDRYNYQGAELSYAGFDELTQIREVDYLYIHGSRMRRGAESKIPVRTRAASNPGGVGHKWVQRRFGITPAGTQRAAWKDGARSVTAAQRPFIPSKLTDNTHLDAKSYLESLSELDEVTLAQLRDGKWVLDGTGLIYGHYQAERNNVEALPQWFVSPGGVTLPLDASLWNRIFVVDLGSSVSTATTGLLRLAWHPHIRATYVEKAWKEAGLIPSSIAKICKLQIEEFPGCELVMDEGALGHGYGNEMRDVHHLPVIAAEKRDKKTNRKLLNGALKSGEVLLVQSECVELQEELEALLWDKAGNDAAPGMADHLTDALLYGRRRSYAHRSEAPSDTPLHGSDEWFAAEERRLLDLEYERAERSREESPWTSWKG
jgi:hypothetical protein